MIFASAEDCWNDLLTRIRAVPELAEKTESVWSENDLLTILQGAKSPMAGVVYGGIAANSGDPSRQGMSTDFTATILIIVDGDAIGGLDEKPEAIRLLGLIRNSIVETASPTAHKWRFIREVPAGSIGNKIIFRQMWATEMVISKPKPANPQWGGR